MTADGKLLDPDQSRLLASLRDPRPDLAVVFPGLAEQRLLGLGRLLVERGLAPPDWAESLALLSGPQVKNLRTQSVEEARVVGALHRAGCRVLVLKGALLGSTIYPEDCPRVRVDLDLLVEAAALDDVRAALAELGYGRSHPSHGGPPPHQEQWETHLDDVGFAIDVHWDLNEHPALRHVFTFDELWSASVALPRLHPDARGLGRVHAILHAAMHYFGHSRGVPRPLQWLLDVDLLWRAMDEIERRLASSLAAERGIASLLAGILGASRSAFRTPVAEESLARLDQAGRAERVARLLKPHRSLLRDASFAIACEPDWRSRLVHLRALLLPPADYMRRKYPEGSRLGVAGLYFRRVWRAIARAAGR